MKTNKGQLAKLKVKTKSLAEESRIIRKEERKMLIDHNRHHASFECQPTHMRSYLTDEYCYWYESLREHRVIDVRGEARATHIAIAYLKGKSYNSIEKKCHCTHKQHLALLRASVIVERYGDNSFRKILQAAIKPGLKPKEQIFARQRAAHKLLLAWIKED